MSVHTSAQTVWGMHVGIDGGPDSVGPHIGPDLVSMIRREVASPPEAPPACFFVEGGVGRPLGRPLAHGVSDQGIIPNKNI